MKISKKLLEVITIKTTYKEEGDAVEYMHQNGYSITNFNHTEVEVVIVGQKILDKEKQNDN